jgi:hypothetical protein
MARKGGAPRHYCHQIGEATRHACSRVTDCRNFIQKRAQVTTPCALRVRAERISASLNDRSIVEYFASQRAEGAQPT